jgi:hypothetical protein
MILYYRIPSNIRKTVFALYLLFLPSTAHPLLTGLALTIINCARTFFIRKATQTPQTNNLDTTKDESSLVINNKPTVPVKKFMLPWWDPLVTRLTFGLHSPTKYRLEKQLFNIIQTINAEEKFTFDLLKKYYPRLEEPSKQIRDIGHTVHFGDSPEIGYIPIIHRYRYDYVGTKNAKSDDLFLKILQLFVDLQLPIKTRCLGFSFLIRQSLNHHNLINPSIVAGLLQYDIELQKQLNNKKYLPYNISLPLPSLLEEKACWRVARNNYYDREKLTQHANTIIKILVSHGASFEWFTSMDIIDQQEILENCKDLDPQISDWLLTSYIDNESCKGRTHISTWLLQVGNKTIFKLAEQKNFNPRGQKLDIGNPENLYIPEKNIIDALEWLNRYHPNAVNQYIPAKLRDYQRENWKFNIKIDTITNLLKRWPEVAYEYPIVQFYLATNKTCTIYNYSLQLLAAGCNSTKPDKQGNNIFHALIKNLRNNTYYDDASLKCFRSFLGTLPYNTIKHLLQQQNTEGKTPHTVMDEIHSTLTQSERISKKTLEWEHWLAMASNPLKRNDEFYTTRGRCSRELRELCEKNEQSYPVPYKLLTKPNTFRSDFIIKLQ